MSSSQTISINSDTPPEDDDNDSHALDIASDWKADAELAQQPTMKSKGKQRAQVGSNDDEGDDAKSQLSTIPKGKERQVEVMSNPRKSSLKKTPSQPLLQFLSSHTSFSSSL